MSLHAAILMAGLLFHKIEHKSLLIYPQQVMREASLKGRSFQHVGRCV